MALSAMRKNEFQTFKKYNIKIAYRNINKQVDEW